MSFKDQDSYAAVQKVDIKPSQFDGFILRSGGLGNAVNLTFSLENFKRVGQKDKSLKPRKHHQTFKKIYIFFVSGPRTLHDLSCQFGTKGFSKEMRQIAGGSQSGLKKFLQQENSANT